MTSLLVFLPSFWVLHFATLRDLLRRCLQQVAPFFRFKRAFKDINFAFKIGLSFLGIFSSLLIESPFKPKKLELKNVCLQTLIFLVLAIRGLNFSKHK